MKDGRTEFRNSHMCLTGLEAAATQACILGKIIKGFGEREGKGRRKEEKKKKAWGKYNFWQ